MLRVIEGVIFLCFVMGSSVVGFYSIVEPIKYLLNAMECPLIVTAMVCWKFDEQLQFTREFLDSSAKENRDYQFAITDLNTTKFPNVQDEHKNLIIVDLRCNQTSTFLEQIGFKVTNGFKWIALDNGHDIDEIILDTFRQLPVLPNSEVFCISRSKSDDGFVIRQVYRTSMANDLIVKSIGIYRTGELLDLRDIRSYASQRRNLKQTLLRATLVVTNNETLNHLDDYRDIHIDTITKVCYFQTNYLIDYVNGKVKYSFVNSWGYMNTENGNWTGMIGDLVDNRSDIGASALFFTADRVPFIEYIAMPAPTKSKFVFRSPKLSYTDNVFLLPFHYFVWYSLVGLIFTISIVLFVTTYVEWQILSAKETHKQKHGILRPSPMEVFFLVFGASCQQGSSVTPRGLTARIIMMFTFTTLMFLYTSYSANIVALLQSPSNKIQTLEDLLNSRLKLGVDDTIFNRYYFSHATERIRKQIYKQKILKKDGTDNFISLQCGVEKIRKGLFAFHMETGVGYKIVGEKFLENEKCGLQEIQYLQVIDPWYAIQKNSSYKELFKVGMMRINEHGLQERENSKLYTKKPKCSGTGGNFITASLIDTRPALLVLLWGFLLSFGIFIMEILIHKKILCI